MPIYEPKGRAREYSPRALNLYNGCDHNCAYCYARSGPFSTAKFVKEWKQPLPRKDIVDKVSRYLDTHTIIEQVLLCFTGDPYGRVDLHHRITRKILWLFLKHRVPTAILTKGGQRCLRDLDLFEQFVAENVPIKVGATLTFRNPADSANWEPGASSPDSRLSALGNLARSGISTWISCEPVIDPEQTLHLLSDYMNTLWHVSYTIMPEIKIGKWNHDKAANNIDWDAFANKALDILLDPRLSPQPPRFYLKHDLRDQLKPETIARLTRSAADPDHFNLRAEPCPSI